MAKGTKAAKSPPSGKPEGAGNPKPKQRKAEGLEGGAAAKPPSSKRQKKSAAAAEPEPEEPTQPSTSGRPAEAEAGGGSKAQKKGKKGGSEIDELFGQLKGKEAAKGKVTAEAKQQEKPAAVAQPKVQGSKDDIFGTETGKARKRTEEGYAIYSEEELGLNRKEAGNTPDCPFDCTCCT